jgi:hypothetical protein
MFFFYLQHHLRLVAIARALFFCDVRCLIHFSTMLAGGKYQSKTKQKYDGTKEQTKTNKIEKQTTTNNIHMLVVVIVSPVDVETSSSSIKLKRTTKATTTIYNVQSKHERCCGRQ